MHAPTSDLKIEPYKYLYLSRQLIIIWLKFFMGGRKKQKFGKSENLLDISTQDITLLNRIK